MKNYVKKDLFGSYFHYFNEERKLHRTDGPAVEGICDHDKYKVYYINGKRHRTDGPAREYNNGDKEWYLNGNNYSEQEFNEIVNFPMLW